MFILAAAVRAARLSLLRAAVWWRPARRTRAARKPPDISALSEHLRNDVGLYL